MAYYARYEPDETGALQKVVYNCGIGFCLPFYGETAPPGTLACDGSEISRTVYDELFQVLGTKAGVGDGSTTFNLPDLRGQFVRGTGGNAAALGTVQGDAIRNIAGAFALRPLFNNATDRVEGLLAYSHGPFKLSPAWGESLAGHGAQAVDLASSEQNHQLDYINFNASYVVPTATENRPTNTALLWCIIYE